MSEKILTCIGCPVGCELIISLNGKEIEDIKGNKCGNGKVYAIKECTNPTRMFTSIVKVINGEERVVSIRSTENIPKDKIGICISELKQLKVKAPIKIGQIVLRNIAGTNINMIATKNVDSSRK